MNNKFKASLISAAEIMGIAFSLVKVDAQYVKEDGHNTMLFFFPAQYLFLLSLTLTCTTWYFFLLISVGFLAEEHATKGLQR